MLGIGMRTDEKQLWARRPASLHGIPSKRFGDRHCLQGAVIFDEERKPNVACTPGNGMRRDDKSL